MHYVEAYYQHNSIHIEIWQLWSCFSVSQSAWTPIIAALFLLRCSCNLRKSQHEFQNQHIVILFLYVS